MTHIVSKYIYTCLILLVCVSTAYAQERTVTGVVTDASTDAPLPGVNVVVEGTTTGTTTDIDGRYSLTVPGPDVNLVFSFVGYEPQEIVVGDQTEINVTLSEDIAVLGEIVAIGYGTIRREAMTGSVSSVEVAEADIGLTSSPQELLQGRTAGVQVIRNNGEPGAGATVRIRGGTSINASNDPLYVIDGVPIDPSNFAPGGFGTARNPLSFINANDIESMDVLKDAAATAIYGARGANGVVLITTKSGSAGRLQVEYSGAISSSTVARQLDLLTASEYEQFIRSQVDAGNLPADRLDQLGEANTDWQDALLRTSVSTQHNLALSGGLTNTQYRASVGFEDEQGIVINTGQQRLTGRFNADHQALNNRLRFNLNLSTAVIRDTHIPNPETAGFIGGAIAGVVQFNPTYPVRDPDGNFFEYSNSVRNPVAATHQIDDITSSDRTIGNLTAAFDIIDQLTAQINVGGEVSSATRRTYLPSDSPWGEPTQGRAEQDEAQRTSRLLETTLSYDQAFGNSVINAVAGFSYQDWIREGFGAAAETFITDFWQWNNLGGGSATGLIPYSFKNENRLVSGFGRVNFDFDGRYLVQLSLRRDGSSRFGEERRWGYFPSGAIAWRLSRDLSLPQSISDLKLRIGYGETGNQEIGNYRALQTLAPGFRAVFGQNVFVGVAPNQFANPNLQWEETATFNAGLDYGLLDNRLTGSIEYYIKDTDNLLVEVDVPQPAVVSTRIENIGKMRNTGFEFALQGVIIDQQDLSFTLEANLSTNRNEVVSLGGGRDRIVYGSVSGPGLTGVQSQIILAGHPVASFYGPEFVEVDAEGRQVFNDYSDTDGDGIGDEIIGTTTSPSTEDRQIIGNPWPSVNYGLTGSLIWGNWDASIFFRGVSGVDVFNNTALTFATKSQALTNNNFLQQAVDDGTALEEAPVYSSRWIHDGSFLRLDYLTVGYTFNNLPQVNRARLYVRAHNLFVLTGYEGFDPEVRTDNAGSLPAIGVDYLNYPRPRTFTFGVNLSF